MNAQRSRLYKRLEKKSRKNLLFNLVSIALITIILLKFGVPLITNLTLFISGIQNSDEKIEKAHNVSYIPPPILNPLLTATNSAEIVVSGIASSGQTIHLYINNIMTNQTKVKEDGTFSFNVALPEKENIIKAKVIADSWANSKQIIESDFSQSLKISYITSPPTLNIESPVDGQSFSKEQTTVEVRGKTDPFAKVTINGFRAIIDQLNNFSYNLVLKEGENKIVIEAFDEASNKTEKTLTVTYSP